ncbi:remorin 1.4-like [Hibiscus syriacus]|uniref:remorin 1.4-like n=1 Tax=Hibiscus syriacus TaxID=106335 RepID=UPI0019210F92|nr:remorin 1.4-like [Hibiscus syriacus]
MNKVRQYETEFAVGVAAAAYVVNSIEKDEARHRITIERSRQDTISRVRNPDRVTRRYSSNQVITAGQSCSRKPMETRKAGGSSAGDQRLKGNYPQRNALETKADDWEKAELDKLNKRYERMKASILAWEKEKKLRAKIKMERRKKELEKKMKRRHQLYELKISRIDEIAGGARAQIDEKRRNEELKIKDKSKQMRASGVVPVSCFFLNYTTHNIKKIFVHEERHVTNIRYKSCE